MEPVDLTSSGSNVSCTVSASVHTVLEVNGCSITVRSTHTSPGKAVPVRVQYGLLPPINVSVPMYPFQLNVYDADGEHVWQANSRQCLSALP